MAKFCPNCGTPAVNEKANFCVECGTDLRKPTAKADETGTGDGAPRLDESALASKSKKELIQMIIHQERVRPKSTEQLAFEVSKIPFTTRFGTKIDTDVQKYERLPSKPSKQKEQSDSRTWRIKLLSANPDHKLVGMDIWDDVLIGRAAPTMQPDFDLTDYGGAALGVSRRHAMLRPTESSLFLIDLNSTNGTFRNGSKVQAGIAQQLKDKDTVSFGGVHFQIKFVIEPKDRKALEKKST